MEKELALKNSIAGVMSRIVISITSLICSGVFVSCLGVELRGINGTFFNVLNLLRLAEMGIGGAVVYALYQPIIDDNKKEIQLLLKFYKKLYVLLGISVFLFCVFLSVFLKFIIVDTTKSWSFIVLVYYIQVANAVCTYFCAYKRNFLYADRKSYVCSVVEMSCTLIVSVLKVLVMILCKSYILYLLLEIIYTVSFNGIVNLLVNKKYPFVREKVEGVYEKASELIANIKNITLARIGDVIYNSTDNLLITRFVGLAASGYAAFYYEVKKGLWLLGYYIANPVKDIFGIYIRENEDIDNTAYLFCGYTFIMFCVANVITVGFCTLMNVLIEFIFGKNYVLSFWVPVLMGMDLFVQIIKTPIESFVNILGLFQKDRNISLTGAVMNLTVSILLVQKIGITGVLAGTVISQAYLWMARGRVLFQKYFETGMLRYIYRNCLYIFVTIADVVLLVKVKNVWLYQISFIKFLVFCILCVVISLVTIFLCFGKTREFELAMKFVRLFFDKIKKKGNREWKSL